MTMVSAIIASILAIFLIVIGVKSLRELRRDGVVSWGMSFWVAKDHPVRATVLVLVDVLCIWGGLNILWDVWS